MRSDKELLYGWFKMHGITPSMHRFFSLPDHGQMYVDVKALDKRFEDPNIKVPWNLEFCFPVKTKLHKKIFNIIYGNLHIDEYYQDPGLIFECEENDYTIMLNILMEKLNNDDSFEFHWKRKQFGKNIYTIFKSREELEMLLSICGI